MIPKTKGVGGRGFIKHDLKTCCVHQLARDRHQDKANWIQTLKRMISRLDLTLCVYSGLDEGHQGLVTYGHYQGSSQSLTDTRTSLNPWMTAADHSALRKSVYSLRIPVFGSGCNQILRYIAIRRVPDGDILSTYLF
ncbi:hypothetical protein RRG08_052341 [Elysia crispata]|uniref:Uncharacterized protein n=1 Tax=Elysia crispata TaxID=231223 RepID=A0AAE1A6F0_9GAST|nr:hypothetical protein RRG08_052341 [Elysia crispata]